MPLGETDDPAVDAWGRRVVALSQRIEAVIASASDADIVVALSLLLITVLEANASRQLLPPMEAVLPQLKLIVATFGAHASEFNVRH